MVTMSSASTPDAQGTPGAPARRQRTPSSDIERELIAAAEAVLIRDGPGAVTVRAVAAEAGIAPMGVYNRLGGKDGLVDALLIRGFDALRASIAGGDQPDPLERLRACGLRYRSFALTNRHYYAIMFEGALPARLRLAGGGGARDGGVRRTGQATSSWPRPRAPSARRTRARSPSSSGAPCTAP